MSVCACMSRTGLQSVNVSVRFCCSRTDKLVAAIERKAWAAVVKTGLSFTG